MCWSPGVSLGFGLLGLACTAFLYQVGRKAQRDPASTRWSPECVWHALWVGNIACVELCEFVIWLNVLPFWNDLDPNDCPAWNKIGTFGVFTFGFANWSWLIGWWCHGTTSMADPQRRHVFSVWRWFATLTSFCWFVSIIIGEIHSVGVDYVADASRWRFSSNNTRPFYYRVYDDLDSTGLSHSPLLDLGKPLKTCSFQEKGMYPHLHWRFAMAHVPWLPSMGWTFFATMFLPFFFYRPLYRSVPILTWGAVTYLVPYAILPVEETMSVFWWLGFGFEIIFIAEPFYVAWLERVLRRTLAPLKGGPTSPSVRASKLAAADAEAAERTALELCATASDESVKALEKRGSQISSEI